MSGWVLDLREPHAPYVSIQEISDALRKHLGNELQELLSIESASDQMYFQLAKCIWRFQDHTDPAEDGSYSPQNKELAELEMALGKAVSKFQKLSAETKSDLDHEVLTRAPFNAKFFFPEQVTYWKKNTDTCKTAQQKMELVGFAIKQLRRTRAVYGEPAKKPRNEDLTRLVHNLDHWAAEFSGIGYKGTCYDVDATSSAEGDFLNLVVILLDAFAPKAYHSRRSLAQVIKRARDRNKPLKDI